jgi:hypothetical protein
MRYIEIGERIGIVTVLELWFDGEQRIAKCECDCGVIYQKRTDYLRRRRGKTEVSCGCLRRAMNREKMADARAKRDMEKLAESGRTLRKRSMEDPTPWEIAERCAEIHEEAGRELPPDLAMMLSEFRKNQIGYLEHV